MFDFAVTGSLLELCTNKTMNKLYVEGQRVGP